MAKREWVKVLDPDELPEGRVKTVTRRHRTLCLSRHKGAFGALDNRCPHQGGPLGEGSIENGLLRCPWHGWDFDPTTGASPAGHDDGVESFPIEVRDDGVYASLPLDETHEATISDVVAETLTNMGVRWVFGMVGHSNLGLADALRRQVEAGRLGYIGVRHEGAAAFAVSAYGKLTGRPAAALTIAGPGATNLLTGMWDAHVDHAPAIALTGQVKTQFLGRGAFQEVDLGAAFGGVARWTASVLERSDAAELAVRAVKHAILDEGPTHLIFPDEVQPLPAGDQRAAVPDGRITPRRFPPDPDQFLVAEKLIIAAKRPVFVVGHGARFAMDEVIALAEQLGCPVLTTFKAKGQIGDDHPLGAGVLGRSGTPIASWFMNEADLLVVWGASFSNHTGLTSKIPTVQIDRDPKALGRVHAVAAPVLGEIGRTADAMRRSLLFVEAEDARAEVAERWQIWRDEKQRRHAENQGKGVHSVALFDALSTAVDDDAIICVDVGNNTYSFGRYFEARRQTVLMSGYLGSIGFGLPAALGAWAATQEEGTSWHGRQVVSVSGDGGLGQYLAELTTLVKAGTNITHVLLNNGELGKISKEQRAGDWDVWQTTLHNPDFRAFAENCGLLGIRVERAEELAGALRQALDHDGPALVEVMTDVELI